MTEPSIIDIRLVRQRDGSWIARVDGEIVAHGRFRHSVLDKLEAVLDTDRTRLVCAEAIEKWGPSSQLMKLAEECTELATAAHHFVRGRAGAREHMVAEIADVLICIMQARMMLDITGDELMHAVGAKIDRLRAKLAADKGDES